MLTHHPKFAKMLRYLSYQIACDVTFVWWMLSWFVTRHVLFCKVIASAYWDVSTQLEFGSFERGYWLTKEAHTALVILLVILEVSVLSFTYNLCRNLLLFVIDNSEHLVVPDIWSSISRIKG